MSSTNRGGEREVSDYYWTPKWTIEQFLDALLERHPELVNGTVLDPCGGGDATNEARYPAVLRAKGFEKVWSIDIREDSKADVSNQDYLTYNTPWQPDLIVTNPPFSLAQEIIEKALLDVADGGFVAMLLRLNFFGAQKRLPFWRTNIAKYAFVHSRRVSFHGASKTDSIEYMHCVWQKGSTHTHAELHILG